MRRKGVTTTLQERLEIGEKSAASHTDPEIATMMGLALPTVRKWRRLYQKEGRAGQVSLAGSVPNNDSRFQAGRKKRIG